jgi:hypothetical protein
MDCDAVNAALESAELAMTDELRRLREALQPVLDRLVEAAIPPFPHWYPEKSRLAKAVECVLDQTCILVEEWSLSCLQSKVAYAAVLAFHRTAHLPHVGAMVLDAVFHSSTFEKSGAGISAVRGMLELIQGGHDLKAIFDPIRLGDQHTMRIPLAVLYVHAVHMLSRMPCDSVMIPVDLNLNDGDGTLELDDEIDRLTRPNHGDAVKTERHSDTEESDRDDDRDARWRTWVFENPSCYINSWRIEALPSDCNPQRAAGMTFVHAMLVKVHESWWLPAVMSGMLSGDEISTLPSTYRPATDNERKMAALLKGILYGADRPLPDDVADIVHAITVRAHEIHMSNAYMPFLKTLTTVELFAVRRLDTMNKCYLTQLPCQRMTITALGPDAKTRCLERVFKDIGSITRKTMITADRLDLKAFFNLFKSYDPFMQKLVAYDLMPPSESVINDELSNLTDECPLVMSTRVDGLGVMGRFKGGSFDSVLDMSHIFPQYLKRKRYEDDDAKEQIDDFMRLVTEYIRFVHRHRPGLIVSSSDVTRIAKYARRNALDIMRFT